MTFVVGASGEWYNGNRALLNRLGLTGKITEDLEYDCCMSGAISSSQVWKQFISIAQSNNRANTNENMNIVNATETYPINPNL